ACRRQRQIGRIEMALQMAGIEAEPALVSAFCADETLPGKRGCGNPGNGGPPRMKTFVPGAVFKKLEAAGARRQGQALRHDELLLVQAHQTPRSERAGKSANEPGRVKTDLMKCAFGDRTQPRGDLDAEHVSGQHLAPARALLCPHGEDRRQYACCRMNDATTMGVVEIEPVNH